MNKNGLYALVGVLAIVVAVVVVYLAYQQTQKPRLEITVDKSGIQVNGNG